MLSVAWEEWWVQVQHRRTLASALTLWQGKLAQDAFGRWLHYVELSRAKRRSMTKVLLPHTESQHPPKQCFSSSIPGVVLACSPASNIASESKQAREKLPFYHNQSVRTSHLISCVPLAGRQQMEAAGSFGSFHCLAAALSVQAGCQALCCTHPVDRHLPAHAQSLPGMDDTVRAQQGTQ